MSFVGLEISHPHTFIIAEAGVNHGGEWHKGLDLIDAAKAAAADAVKFQHFNSQRLWGDDRIAHLELSDDAMLALKAHADEVGIEFMCTPFGAEEVEFLNPLVRRWKIASGCLAKLELLAAVRDTGKPVILSTGMADVGRIQNAVNIVGDCTLLHCTSAYPCPTNQANLAAMDTLRKHFRVPVGYSDHTQSISIALAAVAMGATVIEKHITMDRNADGPDHQASIEPVHFRVMVEEIRRIEQAIGSPQKQIQPSEAQMAAAWCA